MHASDAVGPVVDERSVRRGASETV
jgi:hypothetical protein